MKKTPKEKTPFQAFREKVLGSRKMLPKHLKHAGWVFSEKGEEAAATYMNEHALDGEVPNFQPPAKCSIVAQSRPFAEWPISLASSEIQQYIYAQSECDVPPNASGLTSKSKRCAETMRAAGV